MTYIEKVIPISDIEQLLNEGYEVEVDSPDGFVPVDGFVDKGMYDEYVLEFLGDPDLNPVRCNANHLFETTIGWVSAQQMLDKTLNVLTKKGWRKGTVSKTGNTIPIVDITVDHPNHRYFTEETSSHNTGVGKSLAMCHMAAASLAQGYNVLYITMEMSEERIAERIDANLMDVPIDQLENLNKNMFEQKIAKIAKQTTGRLIIKEYPTGSANAAHFRALLNELRLKKNFSPDVIIVDYLNICASSRMKGMGGSINSYNYVKAIAEELRGLAVEFDVPLISATQTTRSGYSNSDLGLEDTSESFGLPATADLMFALVSTEELEQLGQIAVKQLKNRYNDISNNKRFILGIDRSKMRLFDVTEDEQTLVDDTPVFDKSRTNDRFEDFLIEE